MKQGFMGDSKQLYLKYCIVSSVAKKQ